jgi:hypothetical protein
MAEEGLVVVLYDDSKEAHGPRRLKWAAVDAAVYNHIFVRNLERFAELLATHHPKHTGECHGEIPCIPAHLMTFIDKIIVLPQVLSRAVRRVE